MKIKTILLTIFLFTGISFNSCSDINCDCCQNGESKAFFDIQDMELKHWDLNSNLITGNRIQFEEYGFINVHFLVEYVAQKHKPRLNFSLMNTAYGCSPVPPGEEGSKEEAISSFQIITLNDFDEDHKAGDSINDLLELVDMFNGNDPLPLEEFLNNLSGNVPSEYFILRLNKRPTANSEFQIKGSISLSTGENYEEISNAIRFI